MRYIDIAIKWEFLLPSHSYGRNLTPQRSVSPSLVLDVLRNCFSIAESCLLCFVQVSRAFLHLFQKSNGSKGLQLAQPGLFCTWIIVMLLRFHHMLNIRMYRTRSEAVFSRQAHLSPGMSLGSWCSRKMQFYSTHDRFGGIVVWLKNDLGFKISSKEEIKFGWYSMDIIWENNKDWRKGLYISWALFDC